MKPAPLPQDKFIRLVSAALDDPGNQALSDHIAGVLARQPDLARVRDQLAHLDRLLRSGSVPAVSWTRLRATLADAIDRAGPPGRAADDFDDNLRRALRLDDRVDWSLLQRRIAGALDRPGRGRIPHVRWRVIGAAGLLAAAAAVALMIIWPAGRPGAPTAPPTAGRAYVQVGPPPPTAARPGRAAVQVLVLADASAEPAQQPETAVSSGGSEPEVFLMVEPPATVLMSAWPAGGV